jgi:hypothetical protein
LVKVVEKQVKICKTAQQQAQDASGKDTNKG